MKFRRPAGDSSTCSGPLCRVTPHCAAPRRSCAAGRRRCAASRLVRAQFVNAMVFRCPAARVKRVDTGCLSLRLRAILGLFIFGKPHALKVCKFCYTECSYGLLPLLHDFRATELIVPGLGCLWLTLLDKHWVILCLAPRAFQTSLHWDHIERSY